MPPKDNPAPDKELHDRMFAALNALERHEGRRITLEDLGARVARAHPGHPEPFSASVVRRWLAGEQAPREREGWTALACALGVDPGWLAFGTGAMRGYDGAGGVERAAQPQQDPRIEQGIEIPAKAADAKKHRGRRAG